MQDESLETVPMVEDGVGRATAALGEPEALFKASPGRQRAKFVLGTVLVALGIAANIGWFGFGPARANHFVLHFLYLVPAIGIGLLWHMWKHRTLRVLVYPEGLVHLQKGEPTSFRWDEIAEVRGKLDFQGEPQIERGDNGEIINVWFECTAPNFQVWNVWLEVARADGATARFTAALAEFPDLVARIQTGTFPILWERVQTQLKAGSVKFGEHIHVTNEGIGINEKAVVPWGEIKYVKMLGKFFNVKRNGAWVSAVAQDSTAIPNLHILFGLAVEHGVAEVSVEEGDDDD